MSQDSELLEAWRGGDTKAGEALFKRHVKRVTRFFYNKASEGIDDLVQKTFLACVESRDRFRGEAGFPAFLLGIARNVLRRHYYYRGRDAEVDFGVTSVRDLGTTPSVAVARMQKHRVLLEGLRSLPVDLQIALELHYWEDMTVREIAAVLDIPAGTVKSRLRRARELLQNEVAGGTTEGDHSVEAWARGLKSELPG